MEPFIEIGYWHLNGNNSGIKYEIAEDWKKKRVLYAFSVRRRCKYIGICRSQKLRQRLSNYKNISVHSGSTNKRIAENIRQELQENRQVLIWAYCPPIDNIFNANGGIEVDLVVGLEHGFIVHFDTYEPNGWNIQQ